MLSFDDARVSSSAGPAENEKMQPERDGKKDLMADDQNQ